MPRHAPTYSLKLVKEKVRNNEWKPSDDALNDAWSDFGWDVSDMAKVLLKLNPRDHDLNRQRNHFYKSDTFNDQNHLLLDFYKARNIKDGENVYIHLYIRAEDNKVIVNSFKELQF